MSVSKSGWHFVLPPGGYPVPAIAGSAPTANFQGSRAVEITGRVTAPGGNVSMSDVTVTAHSATPMTSANELDDATTTETGTFSVFVPPLQGIVYLKAEPRELEQSDYSSSNYQNLVDAQNHVWFDPPSARAGGAIPVLQGQILQFGTFKGYSVQPRITDVQRGKVKGASFTSTTTPPYTLVNGEDSTTIVVKWAYDTRNTSTDPTADAYSFADAATLALGGVAGASPTLVTEGGDAAEAGADTERGSAAAGTSMTHTRTTTYTIADADVADYGKRSISVTATVTGKDPTVDAAPASSASMELAAVASSVSNLVAKRTIVDNSAAATPGPDNHNLTATWEGPGSPGLQHRVAIRVQVNATTGEWEWVIFGTPDGGTGIPANQPEIERNSTPGEDDFGHWIMGGTTPYDLNLAANATGPWREDDSTDTYTLTLAQLKAASHLRIDTRVNGGDWVKHAPAAIPGG